VQTAAVKRHEIRNERPKIRHGQQEDHWVVKALVVVDFEVAHRV
jgi:hypothetical protein